jgi:hypothetical protein
MNDGLIPLPGDPGHIAAPATQQQRDQLAKQVEKLEEKHGGGK